MNCSETVTGTPEYDPTEDAKQIFELIKDKKTNEVLRVLKCMRIPLNCTDKSGMSLLDQASWCGDVELVRFLLKNGVDPNSNNHESGYKSLMFAAIAGHQEICRLLLDYGAHVYSTNSIGKTAAEMAAFVGQHECVSIINSYVTLDEIERLLHPKGKDSDEIYAKEFSQALHSLIKTHVIHPVWIMFFLRDHYETIWQYRKKFIYVLDRVFERQLRSKESNEVMSLKLWLILYTVRETCKFVEAARERERRKVPIIIKNYTKQLLKMEQSDRIRPNLERFLRNAIKAFPYHHCLLFQALVKSVAQIEFGNQPEAFYMIMQALSGQRMVETSHFCATCGTVAHTKRCCKKVFYCHSDCQKLDWCNHRMFCEKITRDETNEQGNSLGDGDTSNGRLVNGRNDIGEFQNGAKQPDNEQFEKIAIDLTDVKLNT